MEVTGGKLVALGLAGTYLLVAVIGAGLSVLPTSTVTLGAAVSLIWFADDLGGMTGVGFGGRQIDQASPGFLVAAFGWIVLIGLPCLVYLAR